jgi:hypothetical protein
MIFPILVDCRRVNYITLHRVMPNLAPSFRNSLSGLVGLHSQYRKGPIPVTNRSGLGLRAAHEVALTSERPIQLWARCGKGSNDFPSPPDDSAVTTVQIREVANLIAWVFDVYTLSPSYGSPIRCYRYVNRTNTDSLRVEPPQHVHRPAQS